MNVSGKIYFISEHANQELIHGGIGPVDIEILLLKNNAIPIRFPYHFEFSLKAKVARFFYMINAGLTIAPGSVVVFQHPVYARMSKSLLRIISFRKTIRVICLVADIDGLKDGNDVLLRKEMLFSGGINILFFII